MNSTNITFDFLEKIEKANRDFSLFDGMESVLVGLSGGADSTCLLLSMKALSSKYGFKLYAVHINHMIRGKEADRDEEFSRNLCLKNDVAFFCERVDVPSLSKEMGTSLELCAREQRYQIFSKICKAHGIKHVATAHNSCDNAETIIFNLARGSGSKGLCGIPAKRTLEDGVFVIRPLIYISRSEIEAYLEEHNQDFVTDSTNLESDYTRNYIRNEILPHLRKINPSLEEALHRSARLHSEDEECLMMLANEKKTDDIMCLSALPKAILSRVLRLVFSDVSDETCEFVHIEALCQKIYEYDGTKQSVSFANGYLAKLCKGKLSFIKDERKKKHEAIEFCKELSRGANFFEEKVYALYITFDENKDIPQTLSKEEIVYKLYNTDYLYSDKILDNLVVRNKRDGEKILSCGMHKKIKRLLCETGLDGKTKDALPVIDKDGEAILLPSVCTNDLYKRDSGAFTVSVSLYIKDNSTQE